MLSEMLSEFSGLYRSRGDVFLACPGPSLNYLSLDLLGESRVAVFGVNDVPSLLRCHFWAGGDDPTAWPRNMFHDGGMIKFVPSRWRDSCVAGWPGVVFVRLDTVFEPEAWLHETVVNWGCNRMYAEATGRPPVLSSMLMALKLCYWLGFGRVWLLGVDFAMGDRQQYATARRTTVDGVMVNNVALQAVNRLVEELVPVWEGVGFQVRRCTEDSRLESVEYVPYADAIDLANQSIEEVYGERKARSARG